MAVLSVARITAKQHQVAWVSPSPPTRWMVHGTGGCFIKSHHNRSLTHCGAWTYVPRECKGMCIASSHFSTHRSSVHKVPFKIMPQICRIFWLVCVVFVLSSVWWGYPREPENMHRGRLSNVNRDKDRELHGGTLYRWTNIDRQRYDVHISGENVYYFLNRSSYVYFIFTIYFIKTCVTGSYPRFVDISFKS